MHVLHEAMEMLAALLAAPGARAKNSSTRNVLPRPTPPQSQRPRSGARCAAGSQRPRASIVSAGEHPATEVLRGGQHGALRLVERVALGRERGLGACGERGLLGRVVQSLSSGAVAEVVERSGIRQRIGIPHGPAVDRLAYRELDDLAADRARDLRHLQDL